MVKVGFDGSIECCRKTKVCGCKLFNSLAMLSRTIVSFDLTRHELVAKASMRSHTYSIASANELANVDVNSFELRQLLHIISAARPRRTFV